MDGSKYERDLGCFEACYEVSALGNLRTHWAWRALVLVVASLLVISILPCRAFAAGNYYPGQEVIVDGMVAGNGDVGYMCIAYTNFNAALVALGVSVSDSRLTDDARAKLSNAATGGDFYLFADSFHTRAQLYGNLPSWADDPMLQAYVSQWENIAGSGPIGPYQDIFYATVSPDLVTSAKRDLDTVLDGDDLGGGGTGSDDAEPEGYSAWTGGSRSGNTFTLVGVLGNNVDDAIWNYGFYPSVSEMTDRVFVYSRTYSGTQQLYGYFVVPSGVSVLKQNNSVSLYLYNDNDSAVSITVHYGPTYIGRPSDGIYKPVDLSNTYTMSIHSKRFVLIANIDGVRYISRAYYQGSSTPSVPPTNWPTEPEVPAPTAPEVPEPSEPEIPSQPVQPSAPSLPDFPSYVISPGTTYETFDIAAILDAMDEHCRHLQSAIYTGFSDYFDTYTPWLSQELDTVRACIRGESQWQMDVLHTELDDLQDYLWQLAQWLAARMQFDVGGGGYDDTSVVSWLKRIYFKFGGGSVSTRPIDPVVDPGGIADWLDKLFQQLIDALFGVGANVLAQLLEKLQALEEKFPFCIPWDIGAILGLMVATPEAPAFDLPCYSLTSEGVQQVGVYEIDLSVFDDYMGPIRSMQTILFAAFLCFKVDWFKSALKMEGLS